MLLKRAIFGVSDKGAQASFMDKVQKQKGWMPSPAQYISQQNWSTDLGKKSPRFTKQARNTITDDIFIRSKYKEKSNPGPSQYQEDKQWVK
mmetsp:Transcript_13215/g.22420  ORF Transcript_13215/g.22420 Transcript_13215/m.22420 type:complete len:91 (+) Transcript_13215:768-1040(+)